MMTNTLDTPSTFRTPDALDAAARAALFTGARTISEFNSTPVSDAELSDIWELAKWAPTAANFQPLRVLYVRPPARDRLVKHMADGNKEKTAAAPAVAVLALDSQFHEFIPTVMPVKAELKDYFEADEVARGESAAFNSALQAGYFVLAVRAAGLAAGPMGGFDHAGVDAEFFGDGRWKSILVVNIGHTDSAPRHDRLPRLEHTEVIRWA